MLFANGIKTLVSGMPQESDPGSLHQLAQIHLTVTVKVSQSCTGPVSVPYTWSEGGG